MAPPVRLARAATGALHHEGRPGRAPSEAFPRIIGGNEQPKRSRHPPWISDVSDRGLTVEFVGPTLDEVFHAFRQRLLRSPIDSLQTEFSPTVGKQFELA